MTNIILSLCAYFIDKKFGEFRSIKHPIIFIGDFINIFEYHFYKDSIFRGALLVIVLLSVTVGITSIINTLLHQLPTPLYIIFASLLASFFIAHKMLKDSVAEVIKAPNPKEKIAMLVSRDTENMSESDIHKACIETYAENLSDGVIAPLFYLLLFGLEGLVLYKSVNTLDSMVGYRNTKYENYGKVSALLDDILNYIPSRITALIIMYLGKQKPLLSFYKYGKKHDSPNAGHPITAMALVLQIKLGGDTSYFGKIKKKPYFGKGRIKITKKDVKKALALI